MKNISILPTDKPSRLSFDFDEDKYLLTDELVLFDNQNLLENRHIYITNNEEIKEGDWYFDGTDLVHKKTKYNDTLVDGNKDAKKIILTTDKDLIKDGVQEIDDEFLEWFVKNPSCEWIKTYHVGYVNVYNIIIPKEELKQETIEEAAKNYGKIRNELDYGQLYCNSVDSFKAGAKWQQEQNKNLYSEEEVHTIIESYQNTVENNPVHITYTEWFEQFKKK